MEKNDAIAILEEVKMLDDSMYQYNSAYMEALDIAIKALESDSRKEKKIMREYIIEIDDEVSDESEIFIGYIRRHSTELIHCRDCVWYKTSGCAIDRDDRYNVPVPSDFCSYGEKI